MESLPDDRALGSAIARAGMCTCEIPLVVGRRSHASRDALRERGEGPRSRRHFTSLKNNWLRRIVT